MAQVTLTAENPAPLCISPQGWGEVQRGWVSVGKEAQVERTTKPSRVRWLALAALGLHLCLSICANVPARAEPPSASAGSGVVQGRAADSAPTAGSASLQPPDAGKPLADLAAPTTSADTPVLPIDLPTAL